MVFCVVGYLVAILQVLFVVLVENKDAKKVIKAIITYPIFLITWLLINALAFFNTKIEWKPIKHIKAVDIKDM